MRHLPTLLQKKHNVLKYFSGKMRLNVGTKNRNQIEIIEKMNVMFWNSSTDAFHHHQPPHHHNTQTRISIWHPCKLVSIHSKNWTVCTVCTRCVDQSAMEPMNQKTWWYVYVNLMIVGHVLFVVAAKQCAVSFRYYNMYIWNVTSSVCLSQFCINAYSFFHVIIFSIVRRMLKMIICQDWIKTLAATTMAATTMAMNPPISRRTNSLGNARLIRITRKIADSSKNQFVHRMMKFTFDRITKFQLVDKFSATHDTLYYIHSFLYRNYHFSFIENYVNVFYIYTTNCSRFNRIPEWNVIVNHSKWKMNSNFFYVFHF